MTYRITPKIIYPIGNFKKIISNFWDKDSYDGEIWGTHLGVDIAAEAGTKIFAIGRGVVVYSKLHLGELAPDGKIAQRNWGGLVIIAHKEPKTKKVFYSVYGQLGKRYVKKGDLVEMGEFLGTVGGSLTESNGLWEREHLHFAIYEGPFHEKSLPGYHKRETDLTKLEYWRDPIKFIESYNKKFD